MERERAHTAGAHAGTQPDRRRARVPGDVRAGLGPHRTPQGILRLQSSAGNAAVSRLLSVQRQDPDGAAASMSSAAPAATAEPLSSEAAEPTLSSTDREIDGRTVGEVGADLRGRTGRYLRVLDSFKQGGLDTKQQELDWYGELDLVGEFIDLFNSAPRTDPARWDAVPGQWDEVRTQLDAALAAPITAEGIGEAGRRSEEAFAHFDQVFRLDQQLRDEFSHYLRGFSQSAEGVHTTAVIVRDVSFAAAVSIAVVLAAPAVAAGATVASGYVGLTGTAATVATYGGTALTMGAMGAGIEGAGQALPVAVMEGVGLLNDLVVEGRTWNDAAARFDWGAIGDNGWEGMKRGFVDGLLAYAGLGFDRVLARGTSVMLSRILGQAGAGTLAQVLRMALTRAIGGGASGAVIGALDAGIKSAIEGKSLAEVQAAMEQGFIIGGLAGVVLGGAGGAFEGRTKARLAAEISELQSLLVSNPEEFARRYRTLVEGLTPEQRLAWDTEMQGRRFVDREHYGPAADAFDSGASTVPPAHRYGEPHFRDWQEAAAMLDDHARTGRPLTQAEVEAAHAAAARDLTSEAGSVRGPGVDVFAGGGRGFRGAFSALSPEQIAILERNPHIQLALRGMDNASFTAEEIAARMESAIIAYPEGALVQSKLDDFFRWYTEASATMGPTEFAAAAQRELVSIHPFVDGNGRITRLVMDHALQTRGLPPSLLDNPNLDYMISEAAWTAEVRRGVVESYQTTLRHVDLFNAAIRSGELARAGVMWGSILGLTGHPAVLTQWLYNDDPVCR
ncbi:Fic family protein [Phytomonospora sp. NPDC050363]|uniref:Fic family protein n=1 Tax=Phytomonospora sp. NPDC050363 TaxID=3155642 RepID=UPI0033EF5CA9